MARHGKLGATTDGRLFAASWAIGTVAFEAHAEAVANEPPETYWTGEFTTTHGHVGFASDDILWLSKALRPGSYPVHLVGQQGVPLALIVRATAARVEAFEPATFPPEPSNARFDGRLLRAALSTDDPDEQDEGLEPCSLARVLAHDHVALTGQGVPGSDDWTTVDRDDARAFFKAHDAWGAGAPQDRVFARGGHLYLAATLYGQVCPVLALWGLDGAGERAALYLDFRRADTRARFRVPRAAPRDE